jgi:hypothetical protein
MSHTDAQLALEIAMTESITRMSDTIIELLARVTALEARVSGLERDTPEARQLQYEADLAAADLAESGYDRDYR